MRAKDLIYHVDCFTCISCQKRLVSGERFTVKNDEIHCRAECEALEVTILRYFSQMFLLT